MEVKTKCGATPPPPPTKYTALKTFASDERDLLGLRHDATCLGRDAPPLARGSNILAWFAAILFCLLFSNFRTSGLASPGRDVLCDRATRPPTTSCPFGARSNLSNLVSPTQRSDRSLVSGATPQHKSLMCASSTVSRSAFVHRATPMENKFQQNIITKSGSVQPPPRHFANANGDGRLINQGACRDVVICGGGRRLLLEAGACKRVYTLGMTSTMIMFLETPPDVAAKRRNSPPISNAGSRAFCASEHGTKPLPVLAVLRCGKDSHHSSTRLNEGGALRRCHTILETSLWFAPFPFCEPGLLSMAAPKA